MACHLNGSIPPLNFNMIAQLSVPLSKRRFPLCISPRNGLEPDKVYPIVQPMLPPPMCSIISYVVIQHTVYSFISQFIISGWWTLAFEADKE